MMSSASPVNMSLSMPGEPFVSGSPDLKHMNKDVGFFHMPVRGV